MHIQHARYFPSNIPCSVAFLPPSFVHVRHCQTRETCLRRAAYHTQTRITLSLPPPSQAVIAPLALSPPALSRAYARFAPPIAAIALFLLLILRYRAREKSLTAATTASTLSSEDVPTVAATQSSLESPCVGERDHFSAAFASSRAEWNAPSTSESVNRSKHAHSYKTTQNSTSPNSQSTERGAAFSSMRAEFESPVSTPSKPFDPSSSSSSSNSPSDAFQPPLKPVSTSSLLSSLFRTPSHLLNNLIIPLYEVCAVLWYDLRVRCVSFIERDTALFLPYSDLSPPRSQPESEPELTPEEQQIADVQRNITLASKQFDVIARNVGRSLKQFLDNAPP